MKWYEIVIIAAAVIFVAAVAVKGIIDRSKGKTGCGCGCDSCPHASSCKSQAPQKPQDS